MRLLLALLLPAATTCFILGLTLPLLELERLYFLTDRPALLALVAGLWREQETLLAVVVGLFSIAFPAAKILALHVAAIAGRSGIGHALMHALGKWSMMDVMLVALVVFAAKTSGLASATSLPGLWFYASATVMTALAAAIVSRSR
ncbi:paraquat-inducible protein A [Stappia indica]|uniref:Paraquat-inducible protein A n=1 Tax=Stappia indica TaxID=538381 RepID=A0A285TGN2_9HYPH|nr:paraquat-inducible protein A [Stappia indica]MCC4245331.1 paraquat-inducible protein A [Stappia indica]SOC21212.1 paraquat-inducible protein A [Stappia indica]